MNKYKLFARCLLTLGAGILLSAKSAAQEPEITMTKRQSCLLMQETLSSVPVWRENGVSLDKIEKNVKSASAKTVGYNEEDKDRWMKIAGGAYHNKFNPNQVRGIFGGNCEYITLENGDEGYVAPPPTKPPTEEEIKKNERVKTCIFKSGAYETAALYRDKKHSPEETLHTMKISYPSLDEKFLKLAINNVYFDPNYTYAGGEALRTQMMDLCINGQTKWKPLK